ncbi:MAG: hypothetical protein E7353_08885 [Clostridiales bacterium]|nr:hypothetical protein [Clostridiales bacterium]
MQKQISSTQFALFAFICGMAIKMFMLPALMLKVSGRDSIVVMAFYLIIELVNVLFLSLTLKRNPDKTFYEILSNSLGKIVAKIVVVYFTLFLLLKLLLMLSEVKVFFSVSVYERISWSIMIIPLLALCIGFATKPLSVLGRVSELFAPLILISTVVLSLLLTAKVPISNILPLFSNGINSVVEGVQTFPIWFGDVSLLLVCLGRVKLSKRVILKTMLFRFLSIIFVFVFSLIMFATYADITDLIDYGHNVSSMTQYSLGSHDYGRFDYIIYCFWMLAVVVKIMLNFYTLSQNVQYVVSKKSQYVVPIIVSLVVYILTTFVFRNENAMYQICTSVLRFVFVPAEFLLPFAVFLLVRLKYKKAENTDKTEEEKLEKTSEKSMA